MPPTNQKAWHRKPVLLLILLLACGGCAPFKEVSTYALASQTAIEKNDNAYGYFDFCYDSALVYSNNPRYLRDVDCDCSYGTTTDTVLKHANAIIGAWFAALAKLADNKTVLKTGPVSAAIPAGTYGKLTVTSTEAGVFSALTTAAQDLLTNHYKSSKIQEILRTYHDTVNLAITMLMDLSFSNQGLIRLMSNRFRKTMDSLVSTANASEGRQALITLYRENSLRWELAAAAYDRQYKTLEKIREGHDSLFQNMEKLKDETVKKKVLGFAQNIIYLSR